MRCGRSWRPSWRARSCRSTARMRRGGRSGRCRWRGSSRVDDAHALVTVAAAATGGTRYLTVPVARDARGGLVVSDLPSLAAPPARASVAAASLESVPARERGAIEDVVVAVPGRVPGGGRGRAGVLVPAGVRIGALGAGARARRRGVAGAAAPAEGRTREVLATVRARDAAGVGVSAALPAASWCARTAGRGRGQFDDPQGRVK